MNDLCLSNFNVGMNKLSSTFGDKYFGKDRRNLIYDFVKQIPKEEYENLINNMLSRKSVPLPRDFDNSAKVIRNRIYDENQLNNVTSRKEIHEPECFDCADLGIIEATKEENSIDFKCPCVKGEAMFYKIPVWDSKYMGSFILLQAWPDRVKAWVPNENEPISKVIEKYRKRIKNSEDYWAYYGF